METLSSKLTKYFDNPGIYKVKVNANHKEIQWISDEYLDPGEDDVDYKNIKKDLLLVDDTGIFKGDKLGITNTFDVYLQQSGKYEFQVFYTNETEKVIDIDQHKLVKIIINKLPD